MYEKLIKNYLYSPYVTQTYIGTRHISNFVEGSQKSLNTYNL